MVQASVLVGLVGAAFAGVTGYFWPQIMSCAREHLVPWIDRNVPDLATAVRLAFYDLEYISDALCRAAGDAWCKLRTVLLSQVATFVELFNGDCALRITSKLRTFDGGAEAVANLVTEHELSWESLPEEVRAAAVSSDIRGLSIDIVQARDQALKGTGVRVPRAAGRPAGGGQS
jgi:hypothetical protein